MTTPDQRILSTFSVLLIMWLDCAVAPDQELEEGHNFDSSSDLRSEISQV